MKLDVGRLCNKILLYIMHLSMFSPRGEEVGWRDYPREVDNFEKLGSNSLPMWHNFYVAQFCVKNPLDVPSNLDTTSLRFSS